MSGFLICRPTSLQHVPASIVAYCSKCGVGVWIAPSGQRLIKEKGLKVICLDCFKQINPPMEEIADLNDDQLAEIEQALGFRPSKQYIKDVIREFLGGK